MNISCTIRKSTLESLFASTVAPLLEGQIDDVELMAGLGYSSDAFIALATVGSVRLSVGPGADAIQGFQGLNRRALLELEMIIFVAERNSALGASTGGSPRTSPISIKVQYTTTIIEPTPEGSEGSDSSLLLVTDREPVRGSISALSRQTWTWSEIYPTGQDPPWISTINREISVIEIGALETPITQRRLQALSAGGFGSSRFSIVRVVGDELQFGLMPTYPSNSLGVETRSDVLSFLSQGTQLSDSEDCAVVLGDAASKIFWYMFALGVNLGLGSVSGQSFSIPGGQAQFFFTPSPPRVEFLSSDEYRQTLPLLTTGLCRLDSLAFPSQPIGIDVSLNCMASIDRGSSNQSSTTAVLNYDITVETDLNDGQVDECGALIAAVTVGFGGLAWRIGLGFVPFNSLIAAQVVSVSAFASFVRQLRASSFYEFPVGSRPGGERIQISVPVRSSFGAIGRFAMDLQSIRTTRQGLSIRAAGRFPDELRARATESVAGSLEVRGQSESFPMIFSPVFSLDLGRDCTQAPSSIDFTLWNRSPRPVSVYQIDVISEDWWRIFRSGRVRWQPDPSASNPIIIPPWGTTQISCEFASVQTLNDAVRLASTDGSYRELVILVLSDRLPLVVRWNDPLGRLRTQTPEDVERAREACRRGPISSPWEIIRRPREFDLFPEFQPFWREDLSRVTPRDIQTQLPESSLPWEDSSQLTFTDDARLDASPGVFALLMQSAARRR